MMLTQPNPKANQGGFSLLELVIVLAVISVLCLAIVPNSIPSISGQTKTLSREAFIVNSLLEANDLSSKCDPNLPLGRQKISGYNQSFYYECLSKALGGAATGNNLYAASLRIYRDSKSTPSRILATNVAKFSKNNEFCTPGGAETSLESGAVTDYSLALADAPFGTSTSTSPLPIRTTVTSTQTPPSSMNRYLDELRQLQCLSARNNFDVPITVDTDDSKRTCKILRRVCRKYATNASTCQDWWSGGTICKQPACIEWGKVFVYACDYNPAIASVSGGMNNIRCTNSIPATCCYEDNAGVTHCYTDTSSDGSIINNSGGSDSLGISSDGEPKPLAPPSTMTCIDNLDGTYKCFTRNGVKIFNYDPTAELLPY